MLRQAFVCVLLGLPAVAQRQPVEVITIKLNRTGDPSNMRIQVLPNGHLIARAAPVILLLRHAYNVPANPSPRLSGLPEWAIRERYDVDVTTPVNAAPSNLAPSELRNQMHETIRRLLADRFRLLMRVEQKTLTVYVLSVAGGGPKLQKSPLAEKDCTFDTGAPGSCHSFIAGAGHPLRAQAVDMDDLAHCIENWTDLPVVNRTAVSGLFEVETEGWAAMRLPPPPPGNTPAGRASGDGEISDPSRPTIFTVLRKLGLELKRQEATVPVYTVEHIERPAAN